MPYYNPDNLKSENLTFLTVAEMTSMLVNNADQDGLLFAVKTGATTFQMVMWIKDSTDTVDYEIVYPANGPGRWHAQPLGKSNSKEVLTVVGNTIPSTISGDIDLVALKKTDGTKELQAKFDGVFENLLGTSSGGGTGASVSYYSLNTSLSEELDFSRLPSPSDTGSFSFAIVDVWNQGYYAEEHCYYLYCWIPTSSSYALINTYLDDLNYSKSDFSVNKGVRVGEIRNRERIGDIGSDQPYDTYADWFIWDTSQKWVALVTKDSAINQSSYVRTKCHVDHQGLIIGGEALAATDIPSLDTSKITTGTFNISRIPVGTTSTTVARGDHTHLINISQLSGVGLSTPVTGQVLGFNGFIWTNVDAPSGTGSGTVTLTGDITGTGTGTLATTLANTGTAGTYTKVTTDAKGRVSSGSSLDASDVPSLDTGKITTGVFDITRIPNLSTSKITSGVFDISHIPTGTTSTTVALGDHNHLFNSLSGINIISPANGQILSYDSATSEWKNTTIPEGTGAVNSVDGAFGDVVLTNTYQAKSNELTAIAGLDDSVGYIKKTGDGVYVLDNNISGAVSSVDGLTGAVSLATTYQPISNELTAIAGLSNTTGYIRKTGDGTYTLDDSASGGVTSVDGLTGVVSLTDTYQPKSNELTAFSNLPDTSGFIKKTSDGTYVIEDIAGGTSGVSSVDGLTGTVVLSDKYLALTGGTVTGVADFTSNSPSTSTTTGAVRILSGGLAVAGNGYFGGDISHNGYLKKNGTSSMGWKPMTGDSDLGTILDTSSVTLTQLAQRVKAIQDALSSLGVLDASGDDPFLSDVSLLIQGTGVDNSVSISDSSPIPKGITVIGNTKISTNQSKYNGSSIMFDGVGDYLLINSSFDFAGDFTVECWIYLVNTTYCTFFGGGSYGDTELAITSTQVAIARSGVSWDLQYSHPTTLNSWNHFAYSRENGVLRIFKNGLLIHSTSYPTTIRASANLLIGRDNSGTRQFNGYLSHLRITNSARYVNNFNVETDTYLN